MYPARLESWKRHCRRAGIATRTSSPGAGFRVVAGRGAREAIEHERDIEVTIARAYRQPITFPAATLLTAVEPLDDSEPITGVCNWPKGCGPTICRWR